MTFLKVEPKWDPLRDDARFNEILRDLTFKPQMRIALIGYGRMGQLVHSLAEERGHEVPVIIGDEHQHMAAERFPETLRMADVAIDFSSAEAVRRNVEACMLAGIPLVVGTTGWNDEIAEIRMPRRGAGGANGLRCELLDRREPFLQGRGIRRRAIRKFPEYEAFIEEQHHRGRKTPRAELH